MYRVSPIVQKSGDSGGVTSDITILLCVCPFESVSAGEPVVPTDLNEQQ